MMSCNGCRVLRKGCSESCMLRPCLQWIDSPEAQGHATVFVAKFFGRAGLMSFISAVPESQRPALFQSLLFEACGRTVNPVNGAVGLVWTGNWHVCQTAVETVLRGGTLRTMPELVAPSLASDEASEATCGDVWNEKFQGVMNLNTNCRFSTSRSKVSLKRKLSEEEVQKQPPAATDLDLCLTYSNLTGGKRPTEIRRPGTPSMTSEESGTTTCFDSGSGYPYVEGEGKLLNLFV